MDDKLFQSVFDQLEKVLPDKWSRVVFFAHYTNGSYSMKYYLQKENEPYVDCFKLADSSKAQRRQLFMSIDKVISPIRKSLDENHRWTSFALIVSYDGDFKSFYDYADLTNEPLEYIHEWEKKLLGE